MRELSSSSHPRSAGTAVLALALVVLVGCGPKVAVRVPATPAVDVDLDRVAVVVDERGCQDIADEVALSLAKDLGVTVDPRAPMRVVVHNCGTLQEHAVDVSLTEEGDRRRLTVEGRAYAAMTVFTLDGRRATLVGAGHDTRLSGWGEGNPLRMSRAVDRAVTDLVARDLVEQLSPIPTLAERRLYPSAEDDSARGLTHRAVLAELDGDLTEAHRLASLAYRMQPNARASAYVDELARRLRMQGDLPD